MDDIPLHWATRWARRLGEALLGPGDDAPTPLPAWSSAWPRACASASDASVAAHALDWLDTIERRFRFEHYQADRRELVLALRSGLEGVAAGRRQGAEWWQALQLSHPAWFRPPAVVHRYVNTPTPAGTSRLAYLGATANQGAQRTDLPLYLVLLAYPLRCEQSEALHAFVAAMRRVVIS